MSLKYIYKPTKWVINSSLFSAYCPLLIHPPHRHILTPSSWHIRRMSWGYIYEPAAVSHTRLLFPQHTAPSWLTSTHINLPLPHDISVEWVEDTFTSQLQWVIPDLFALSTLPPPDSPPPHTHILTPSSWHIHRMSWGYIYEPAAVSHTRPLCPQYTAPSWPPPTYTYILTPSSWHIHRMSWGYIYEPTAVSHTRPLCPQYTAPSWPLPPPDPPPHIHIYPYPFLMTYP